MKRQKLACIMLVSTIALGLSDCVVTAEEPTSRGAALAHACATCHGPQGRSIGAIPSINTIPKETLVASLRAFRNGERPGTVMDRIAQGLEEADIVAIAEYFMELRQQGAKRQ